MLRSSRKTRSTSHFRVNKGSFEGYLQFPFKQIYIQKSRINPGSSRPCPWFHHGPAKVDSDEPISELPKHLQKQLFLHSVSVSLSTSINQRVGLTGLIAAVVDAPRCDSWSVQRQQSFSGL